MLTVIRIEHPEDNCGIFRSDFISGEMREKLQTMYDRHAKFFPVPQFDNFTPVFPSNWYCENFYCSFVSIEQVNQWITPEEMKIIIDNGFKILAIDLKEYYKSEFQVIFYKSDIISKKDITSLFGTKENDLIKQLTEIEYIEF